MFSRVRQSQSGFSIVSVLIAFGLTMILMSAVADINVYGMKSQRTLMIRSDFQSLNEELNRILQNEMSCTNALKDADIHSSLVVKDPVAPLSKPLAAVGDRHQTGWTVEKVEFDSIEALPDYPNLRRATFAIEVRKDPGVALGTPTLRSEIGTIYFQIDPGTDVITRCYGTTVLSLDPEAYCTSVGGKWLGSKNKGAECIIFGRNS